MLRDVWLTAVRPLRSRTDVFAFFLPRHPHVATNNAPAADVTDGHVVYGHTWLPQWRRAHAQTKATRAAPRRNRCNDGLVAVRGDIIHGRLGRTGLQCRHDTACVSQRWHREIDVNPRTKIRWGIRRDGWIQLILGTRNRSRAEGWSKKLSNRSAFGLHCILLASVKGADSVFFVRFHSVKEEEVN